MSYLDKYKNMWYSFCNDALYIFNVIINKNGE